MCKISNRKGPRTHLSTKGSERIQLGFILRGVSAHSLVIIHCFPLEEKDKGERRREEGKGRGEGKREERRGRGRERERGKKRERKEEGRKEKKEGGRESKRTKKVSTTGYSFETL